MLLAASGSWTLFQLGLLLAGLLGAALWLRHRIEVRGTGPGGRSIRLTAEHALHVVDVRGRTYVIGTGPAGPPSLLSELPPTPPGEPQRERDGR